MKKLYLVISLLSFVYGTGLAQTNTWIPATSMISPRADLAATTLRDGTVLVTGGFFETSDVLSYSTTEIYSPSSNSWTPGVAMNDARARHTATTLLDGRVLVTGGELVSGADAVKTVQIYDPATASWAAAASMITARMRHTATLLPNGKVLVTGGGVVASNLGSTLVELYDPQTNTWTVGMPMNTPRNGHTATLLPNGKVLVVGGFNGSNYFSSAELYDPATNTWSPAAPLSTARSLHSAVGLTNGKVLVMGGFGSGGIYLLSCELYDPLLDSWSPAPDLPQTRVGHSAALLGSGKPMVMGGLTTGLSYQNASSTALILDGSLQLSNVSLSPSGVCSGQSLTLSATLANATAPYTYTITDGGSLLLTGTASATAFSQSFTPAASQQTTYTFTVESTYGLTSTTILQGTGLPSLSIATANNGMLSCLTPSLTLTASLAGGGSYTYAFAGPGLSTTTTSTTAVANQPGTYTVTARATTGCTTATTITVMGSTTEVVPLTAQVSGTLGTGSPTVTISASAMGATSYSLSGPATATSSTGLFIVNQEGTYQVAASNGSAGNCVVTTSVQVSRNLPAQVISYSSTVPLSSTPLTLTALCQGNRFIFTGPGGYVFSNIYRIAGQYQAIAQGITLPGTYVLTVSSTDGSQVQVVITVTSPANKLLVPASGTGGD